jgi:hypothetical protein
MANFEEEIRDLKAEITKNTARLDKAIDEGHKEDKKLFGNLIIAIRQNIAALRQQQLQGKVIIPSRLSIQHRCCEINPISWLTPHLTISFASFCNIAQAGGEGQGELLCCW